MWLHPDWVPPTFQRGSSPINWIFTALQLLELAAGGYLSFGDAIPSNHCTIWLDFHLPEICPFQQEGYIKPGARRLQYKDPQVVTCYNMVLLATLNHHNIPQCINQLNTWIKKPLISSINKKPNLMILTQLLLMQSAEQKISVKNSNAAKYSDVPGSLQPSTKFCFGKVF